MQIWLAPNRKGETQDLGKRHSSLAQRNSLTLSRLKVRDGNPLKVFRRKVRRRQSAFSSSTPSGGQKGDVPS
jgi:hypothetical protein